MKIPQIILMTMMAIVLTACGGGGGASNSGVAVGAVTQGNFQGLISAISVDAGVVDLAWFEVTDTNGVAVANATYEVYLSDTLGVTPSASTLAAKLNAPTASYRMKDLTPGATVYVKVVAKSSEGVALGSSAEKTVKVSSAAAALRTGVTVMQPSTLGYSAPVITADTGSMKFSTTGSLPPPAAGTILTGLDANGDPYLKKVVSSALVGLDLIVQTTQPALSDVFSNLSLNLQSTLMSAPTGANGQTILLGAVQSNGQRQDGTSVVVPMPSGSLTASEMKYAAVKGAPTLMGGAVVQLPSSSLPFSTSWNGTTINAAVSFNPTLSLDADLKRNWLGVPVDVAMEASANGEVTLDLQLLGQWLVAGQKSIPLASRKYVVRTVVAGIPVWFTPKMSLYLDMEAAGSANIKVKEVYTRTVSIGMARAFGGQWTKTANDQYTHTETIELGAAAGATASLRMVLDLSLYGMVAAQMSPQMYVTALGVLNVNTNSYKRGPSLEMYAGVGYEVGAQADVSIFDITLASWNNDGNPLTQKELLVMQPAQPNIAAINLGAPKVNPANVNIQGGAFGTLKGTMFPVVASAAEAVTGYVDDAGLTYNSSLCADGNNWAPGMINPVYKLCNITFSPGGGAMNFLVNTFSQLQITPSVVHGYPASLLLMGRNQTALMNQKFTGGVPAYMLINAPFPVAPRDPLEPPIISDSIVLVAASSSDTCSNPSIAWYCNVVAAFSVDMSKATDQWSAPTVTQLQGAIPLREGSIKGLVNDMVGGTPPQDQSKAWQLDVY